MLKNAAGRAALARLVRDHRRQAVVVAGALVAVVAALLIFGVSERPASAQSEPETVERVTGLAATAEGQPDGTVRLTWNPAENAQVYFVYYIAEKEKNARNWSAGRMRAFNGAEATIDGLAGGTTYYFAASGMRWHFGKFEPLWGGWDYWQTATPTGSATSSAPADAESEPETVARVTGLAASAQGQPPGAVRLTWNAAENAQVYFVYYIEEKEKNARNWSAGRMRTFNETEGTIDGLDGGTTYYFAASGMRWHFGRFEPLWGGWDYWETATPSESVAPPNISLANLEHGAWLEANKPALADRIKALPWVADEVDDSEREAAEQLIRAARWYPDTFNTLMEMPWVRDSVLTADEAKAILQIRWSAHYSAELSMRMSQKPWVQDGITTAEADAMQDLAWPIREAPELAHRMLNMAWIQDDSITDHEATAIDWIYRLNRYYTLALAEQMLQKSWIQDGITETEADAINYLRGIGGRDADAAAALIAMPFLESLEIRDTLALRSLNNISARDASDRVVDITFRELMSLPKIKDGITDEETKIVAVLGGRTYSSAPGSARVLLAETGVYIEERLIELPHSGETLLAVIRTEDKDTPSMDHFEHAVRSIERFMGVPYPIDYLALLYYDHPQVNNANNNFTHLLIPAEADSVDGPDWHASVIAHEAAHWYWRNDGEGYQYQNWITEGSAEFLRIISEHERIGRPFEPIKPPCGFFDNISELEKANPDRTFIPGQSTPRICYYSLGQRFFLDLYLALGDETFRPAFRTLYLRYRQDDPGDGCGRPPLNICRVEAAFKDGASPEVVAKVDEVINRWYYGVVTRDLEYSHSISLSDDWTEELEGRYSRTSPGSQLRITSLELGSSVTLEQYSAWVRDGLREEWWPDASLFEVTEFRKKQIDGQDFYSIAYRVRESPEYCVVDVSELVTVSSALPGTQQGYRVRMQMCEHNVPNYGQDRTRILDSFRVTTQPSTYYRQYLSRQRRCHKGE